MRPSREKNEDVCKEKEYIIPVILKLSKTPFLLILTLCTYLLLSRTTGPVKPVPLVQTGLAAYCAGTTPIGSSEFLDRQRRLAETLVKHNASAYIAEPGANGLFFFNVSTSDWFLSERPLLLIITALQSSGITEANVSVLTPKFESSRAKMLPIPANVKFFTWPEHENPYEHAAAALAGMPGVIFVDGSMRKFIADGLQKALPTAQVVTSSPEVNKIRERKSKVELNILKCANEVTLLAIRAVHKKLHIGIRESEARSLMAVALADAGLQQAGCLTLFGENAALPHGSGTDRALSESDFALFDCTGSLHGYFSDVTRTVALPNSKIPEEHQYIWYHVHSAQTAASRAAHAGGLANQVDETARSYLRQVGYDSYFSHRLGHGIGLEVHEEPYLHGGSNRTIEVSHTFSNEPGVYIEGKVGVRLEDCFFINSEGKAVFLTDGVGGQAKSPWSP
ncbi:peptidase M24, structural domain-containing protein [Collybia nuda]|uniref:Peptidase M24, structural domain-containing protein n=1 Tax=Collybia nuda TaxID=64659 RepID=A0A9P6CAS4_9AGAR|nr:peptidase M24, structural domain-containing protein [Collybia nuda]